MTTSPEHEREREPVDGPVIRDRRRIDPQTGAVREPRPAAAPPADLSGQPAEGAGPGDAGGRVAELAAALAERTADLQRVQAEYVNYKRRVDRDRATVREIALADVLTALLPVLDDIERAREHGELDGGFKAVADSLERTAEAFGLRRFGQPGDPFDPRFHEAMTHGYSDTVDVPTCQAVFQPGYQLGQRLLRPARVAVVEPTTLVAAGPDESAGDAGADATDRDEAANA